MTCNMLRVNIFNAVSYSSLLALYLFSTSIFLGINNVFTLGGIAFSFPYNIYLLVDKNHNINLVFAFFLICLVGGAFVNSFFTTNGFGGCLVILGILCLSIYCIRNPQRVYRHIYFILLFFLLFCFYKICILGMDPNEFYDGKSRNYLGLILVSFNVLLHFLGCLTKQKVHIIISVLSLILSILLVGRSTIGAIGMLFLLHFTVFCKQKSKCFLVILGILVIILVQHFWTDVVLLYKSSSFGGYGIDTPRYEIWEKFFDATDFFTFVLGMDTFTIPIVAEYSGNLHNEFLNLLARTGIGFLMFILLYMYAVFYYIKNEHYYIVSLLFIFSFRAFFDTGIFINNLGFTFYPLIIYPLFFYGKNSSVDVNDASCQNSRLTVE